MTEGTTTPDVYRAICQVAGELAKDGIAKNKQNQQQGYRFRGIDDIYTLSGVLSGAGLCILPRMVERSREERATAKGGVLFYVTVRAEFDFVSMKDGSKHTISMYGEAMDSADKATNKAMSAAFKYCCLQTFAIPTEGMEDGDAQTPEPVSRHPQPITVPVTAKTVADAKLVALRAGVPFEQTSTVQQPSPEHMPELPEPQRVKSDKTSIADMVEAFQRLKPR